jgi:hypothetical protein
MTTPGAMLQDYNVKDVYGSWSINDTYGLYPSEYVNKAWNPLENQNMARCTFGSVRKINDTWTEKYYLNNINRATTDYTAVVMRYGTFTNSLFFPGSYEICLVVEGGHVYVEEYQYVLGAVFTNKIHEGYHIPSGTISGNLSYKAVPMSPSVNPDWYQVGFEEMRLYDYYVYWEDQLVFVVPASMQFQITGSDDYQRQADIRTNIVGDSEAYVLQVLSHYEDVHVSAQAVTNYESEKTSWEFVGTLLGIYLFNIPFDTGIPTYLLLCFVDVPVVAVGYIGVRLVRGN